MQRLITKAMKATVAMTLFPMSFIAVFGTMVLYAWTGTTNPSYEMALCLVGLCGFLGCLSLLGLVLYRVSGRALLDNIRQVMRIVIVLSVGLMAKHLGFAGVLAGLASAELAGMIFMGYAMSKTFKGFSVKPLARDFVKLTVATAAILTAGFLASHIPLPQMANARLLVSVRLVLACVGCLIAAWPVIYLTGAVTAGERRVIVGMVPRRFRPAPSL